MSDIPEDVLIIARDTAAEALTALGWHSLATSTRQGHEDKTPAVNAAARAILAQREAARPMEDLLRAIEETNRLLKERDVPLNKWAQLCKSFADNSCDLIDIAYIPVGPGTWKDRALRAEAANAAAGGPTRPPEA